MNTLAVIDTLYIYMLYTLTFCDIVTCNFINIRTGLGRAHEQDCTKIESPRVLFQELKEIGSWEDLCLNLGVSMVTMESLKHESAQNTEKKRQCLKAFYDEDTEPEVVVCWETVVKAVSSFPISNKKLAKKIANKYSINTATIDL